MRPLLPTTEAQRLQALAWYDLSDPSDTAVFDQFTRVAQQLFATPIALLSLVDQDRQWFKSCQGLDFREGPREDAFCAHTILSGEPLVVLDATRAPDFVHNTFVTQHGVRFYAGVPLITPDGCALGSLCVLDTTPRQEVSPALLAALQDLARLAVEQLGYRIRERARREASGKLHLLETIVAKASDAVMVMKANPDCPHVPEIHYVNEAFTKLTGYEAEEVLGRSPELLYGEQTGSEVLERLDQALARGEAVRTEILTYRKDGSEHWVEVNLSPVRGEHDQIEFWLSIRRDITERKRQELRLSEEHADLEQRVSERTQALHALNVQLEHDSLHDSLTGLANRALFTKRLEQAVQQAIPDDPRKFAVLFLDCDRFKVINDTLGHSVGDELLIGVSKRLQALVRPSDLVARLGGDEFTVLLEDLDNLDAVLHITERLLRAFGTPFYVGPHALYIGASVGIVSGEGYTNVDDVMRDADIAMYRAKSEGRGRFVQFDLSMRESTVKQMRMENDLRRALLHDELDVYYQPIVDARSGTIHGLEALARWPQPDGSMISPAEFIPLAEETGLIIELDRWVLFEACRAMQDLQARFGQASDFTLSVNMSTQQFARTDFLETIELVLHASDFPAPRLMIEITESLLMQRSDLVNSNIQGLKDLGVQIHIDDFGSGYSSLSYLQQFAANTLKIDRAFIIQMMERPESAELVRTIIMMAHNLGMTVVAEGVETSAQLEVLRASQCEFVQGFLFSRPLSLAVLSAHLEQQVAAV
ncbi:sensor domain-containing phosphodiesterase [Deinococcus peraridilitoris]|uniref:PAS domain S-box/diguanylate cyclase (GGDEF) domain-containing protein n=1 Tax=Deinococcus peraridilitoris (strain DSM 19664 / LMG 22246 / CIP 109416 / KR-200) TaxID=937777 RepID=K9ZZE7_DEIPD|nr:EAL domain-containing protein [Deinococcus peraridilitoris]AFZ66307.1 PAS domain S-box/diguanylate cyclase (GGDEF) domain-containing protein [Deinococcus peraridilitoris DSM 19664]